MAAMLLIKTHRKQNKKYRGDVIFCDLGRGYSAEKEDIDLAFSHLRLSLPLTVNVGVSETHSLHCFHVSAFPHI